MNDSSLEVCVTELQAEISHVFFMEPIFFPLKKQLAVIHCDYLQMTIISTTVGKNPLEEVE